MHHMPENDHEAAMARADLYKLAQYSAKLFKMIQEGQQLEGWVQAKITKSADYIASVYHFMAYEMKVSEYGEALENAEVYESELREKLQQRLMEAKEKVKALKKVDAMKHKKHKSDKELDEMAEGWEDMVKAAKDRADDKGTGKFDRKELGGGRTQYTRKSSTFSDGGDDSDVKKAKKKAKDTNEGAKPDFLDMDKDGNKKEPMKKAVADKKKNPFAKKTNEALKGGQKKLDMDKDGKLEKSDFAKLRASKGVKETAISGAPQKSGIPATAKTTVPGIRATQQDLKKAGASAALGEGRCNETPKGKMCPVHGMKECGSMYEASHQEKTTMKHVKNPTAGEKAAAKDIKPGIKGYRDRADMLKSAEKDGRLKD